VDPEGEWVTVAIGTATYTGAQSAGWQNPVGIAILHATKCLGHLQVCKAGDFSIRT
jgi:hypothetical protein